MTNNNQKNINELNNLIVKKTNLKNIKYINKYDNYYLVKDDEYLYIFDNKFKELLKIDNIIIHDNKNNYDIIYHDNKAMYLNDYLKDNKIVYEYYDLYDYKLIKKIVIGG